MRKKIIFFFILLILSGLFLINYAKAVEPLKVSYPVAGIGEVIYITYFGFGEKDFSLNFTGVTFNGALSKTTKAIALQEAKSGVSKNKPVQGAYFEIKDNTGKVWESTPSDLNGISYLKINQSLVKNPSNIEAAFHTINLETKEKYFTNFGQYFPKLPQSLNKYCAAAFVITPAAHN